MAPDIAGANSSASKPKNLSKNSERNPIEPNVLEAVFGNLLIRPWYPSFYPEALVGRTVERLYVCQWCFKYSKELMGFLGHLGNCELRSGTPPGEEIYCKDGYSLFEIDGEECKVRCHSSLLSHVLWWGLQLQLQLAVDGCTS